MAMFKQKSYRTSDSGLDVDMMSLDEINQVAHQHGVPNNARLSVELDGEWVFTWTVELTPEEEQAERERLATRQREIDEQYERDDF